MMVELELMMVVSDGYISEKLELIGWLIMVDDGLGRFVIVDNG